MRYGKASLFLVLSIFFMFNFVFSEESRLLRFPDIHNDKMVFVYAGDLWVVSKEGGVAQRLTSDVGMELCPKFSPDGKMIAFTGQYEGNTNVYAIPAEGGTKQSLESKNQNPTVGGVLVFL